LRRLLTAAVLCNGARLKQENGTWRVIGDPTEGALLVAAAKAAITMEALEGTHRFLGEVPFSPERKRMTIVRQTPEGPVAFVKGAPDILLQRCTSLMTGDGKTEPLTEDRRRAILDVNAGFAHAALRVLALAQRRLESVPESYRQEELERDLVFLGLAAMKDPLRPEAKAAVELCHDAGIRTVMITGDHKDTAAAIAAELGVMKGEGGAVDGSELDRLSDDELARIVDRIAVYARVSAEHKLRIVQAWKRQGAIVAMTGDGVNDAPAIKAADIGVAMGITGTDVTKEASDMVVTDDNFASIAAAVEEGRGVYDNIRKSVHYLLSCNISEILLMLLATLFALPLPLLPVQILWINLVTDGLPALALAVDPKDPDLMRRPPRAPTERFLTKERILLMSGQGMFLALISMFAFVYCLYGMDVSLERARTLTFTIMVLAQLAHALNCRNDRRSVFAIGLWTNKPLIWAVGISALLQTVIALIPSLHPVFRVTSFDPDHWLLAIGLGLSPLVAMESWKLIGSLPARSGRGEPQ
jgi:Ca2+-transporting ATPase